METPKEYHYTYYSYEEWGRGYFGSRTCKCLPEEDVEYFGSFYDKIFKPTQKIILKGDYNTRTDAIADEVILHNYYDVANNPHFANQVKQTSTKFYVPVEKAREIGRKSGQKNYELGIGIHGRTKEKMSEDGRKAGKIGGSKGGKKSYELSLGLFAISKEERKEASRKADETNKKNGAGIYGIGKEKRVLTGKKSAEKVNSQRWECCETGYVSTAAGIVVYQRARGIDTSKSNRRRIV